MKRSLVIFLGSLAGLVPAAVASGRAVPAPRAELRRPICQTALDPASRAIAIEAVMRPVTGTARLQLRFDLLMRRKGSSSYRTIRGGDLGRWISPQNLTLGSRPGDVWNFDKQVVDLAAPAAYRFRVSFRWISAHRRVIAVTSELAPKCAEPELRADLQVRGVVVESAAKPTRNIYLVSVANGGASAAGPFMVQFAPGGSGAVIERSVAGLAADAQVVVQFDGPACVSGVSPTITVDPAQQVEDYNRSNNVVTVTCPPRGAASGGR